MRALLVGIFLVWAVTAQAQEKVYPGPFPLKGPIFGPEGQRVGTAHSYPRFVEIHHPTEGKIGRIGVLVEAGWARVHIVRDQKKLHMVGHAHKGKIYNMKKEMVGSYFWTPTYSYVYDLDGKRVGHTKCIAWPRVCAVGVAGYLLGLLNPPKGETDEANP